MEKMFQNDSVKSFFLFLFDLAKIVLISLLIIIPIRTFVVQPFFVRGQSMEPTFSSGDYLIVDQLSYYLRQPKRGEVVIFRNPQNKSQFYIKRLIGLPGERVQIDGGKVTIYNSEHPEGFSLAEKRYLNDVTNGDINTELEADQYYLLGDNRDRSFDSRKIGPINEERLVGRVVFRAWPLNKARAIQHPQYSY